MTANKMKIEAKPQDIKIKNGRRKARLVIFSHNHQDVWAWNDTNAASPKQIFRGTIEEANEFFAEWDNA